MADTKPTIPSDLVAVYDNVFKQWLLYYISTDAQIKYIKSPKDDQLEDSANNPPYEIYHIDLAKPGLPSPKVGNSQLGAADYVDSSGNSQVSTCIEFGKVWAHSLRRLVSTTSTMTVIYAS